MKLQELLRKCDFDRMFEYIVKFDSKSEGSRFAYLFAYELLCDMEAEEGRGKRGFIRDALHDGPGAVVEFIPVGGKVIWKVSKEIVLRLLRTNMENSYGILVRKSAYLRIGIPA